MSYYHKRCLCKNNKCCHREYKPYPPIPPTPRWTGPIIPIIALADMPSATTVPNGAIVLVGEPQPNTTDPMTMPNPAHFSISVANGCYWNMMAPGALGAD
jgi:hypothetical protein